MERALQLFLVTILLLSLPALSVPLAADVPAPADSPDNDTPLVFQFGPTPIVEDDLNISARLELPADERTGAGIGSAGIDVSAAMTADADGFESQYRMYLLDERLVRAESDSERRNILRDARDTYVDLLEDMRDREGTAGGALATGDRSADDVATEMGLVHLRATQYEPMIAHLDVRATEEPDIGFNDEIRHMETELESMQGPIRADLALALTGERPETTVHVWGAEMGIILATIDGNEYVRETVRLDNRNPGGEIELIGLTAAIDRTETIYPWTFTDRGSLSFVEASEWAYHATSTYNGGMVEIYLDRSTANVYKEHQFLTVTHLDTHEAINETSDDLHLVVDRTYLGGPTEIRLANPETGDPVDGTVMINNRTVGTTGADGSLWTVAPRDALNVTATDGPAEISGSYSFIDQPPEATTV